MAQLLVDEGDLLAFRHDLVRQAAYADIPEPVRVALHRDAARLLSAGNASPLEVAAHLARGARRGDVAAVDGLFTAAAELLANNPSAAADLGLRALELLGHDDGRRAEIGAFTVDALGWADRLAEAVSLGDQIGADVELNPVQQAIIELGVRRSWYQSSNRPYGRPVPVRLINHPDLPPSFRLCLLALEAQMSMSEDLAESARRLKGLRAEADASGAEDFRRVGDLECPTDGRNVRGPHDRRSRRVSNGHRIGRSQRRSSGRRYPYSSGRRFQRAITGRCQRRPRAITSTTRGGKLIKKSGLIRWEEWVHAGQDGKTPWDGGEDEAIMAGVPSAPERAVTDIILLSQPRRRHRLPAGMMLSDRPISDTEVHVLLDGILSIELDGTAITEVGPGAIFDPSRRTAESKQRVTVRARTDCRLAVVGRKELDDDALEAVATEQRNRLHSYLERVPGMRVT